MTVPQVAEADRQVQKEQQERKTALGKQRQAERQLATLESERATCAKTVETLEKDMERLRLAAEDALAQRNAAAGKAP